ncbi:Imidazole glycerol phosphate synthase subunit HisH [bioreactor metagenome]|uniref:Imidazole glycerol phosphate synthase subunit HisH n=1 Tax=bioreactor metagenome TaxID=1076179 RepID=A0A645G4T4_9ZZZZ
MGWNNLKFNKQDPILKYIKEDEYVYFVHSYYAHSQNSEMIAYTEYEKNIPAIVRKDNVYGIQFHPEKSGETGLNILKAYKEVIEN